MFKAINLSEYLLGTADATILEARYHSLLRQIPVLLLCIQVGLLPSFQIMLEGNRDPILLLFAASCELFCLHIVVFFYRSRRIEKNIAYIRRNLTIFSCYFCFAGASVATLVLSSIDGRFGAHGYAIYRQALIFSIVFPVMLIMLGRSAYVYCSLLVAAAVVVAFYVQSDDAWLSAVTAIVFAIGCMSALHRQSQRFDRLVQLQSATEALSQENARLASIDPLTNLKNRRHFFNNIQAAAEAAIAAGDGFVVGVLDLDSFKNLNDTFGHAVGDQVLQEMGERLSAQSHATPQFHRLGGDEFAFYMSTTGNTHDLQGWANSVIASLKKPIGIGHRAIEVSASVGMAIGPDMSSDALQLYEFADYALYVAKQNGGGMAEIFSQSHRQAMRSEREIETTLKAADLDREIHSLFQPIMDTNSGMPQFFEILARWHSPTLGEVYPDTFIPIAERTGLISRITVIMLRQGVSAMREWPEHIGLSLNLSAHDIMSAEVVRSLVETIQNSGLSPQRFVFEITETAVLADIERANSQIAALNTSGIRVALDDFGSGYTSLGQLQFLRLDKIKLDKIFARGIQSNATNSAIVRSVVELCRHLELDLVVEGVEDQKASDILGELGCRYLQGYRFSKPVSRSHALEFLRISTM
ncbi:putative bifunctional diguanylate cyclase/phosphodiesterase [Rhizobium sp. SL86]|uniref:putative bifunctional diguanylate cyclase/phosphodiesterase n=1 Tax=Rhizobium sp. SL86 TaxID=2995148 RepID=UPI0022755019|nr:EAL domain-containing protein [Rhizobium sp. SL86]MCY1667581.1 EAL domain-containing protein [Rhizobium sp. SL86]